MVTPGADWTRFYEAMADTLLQFRHDRRYLVEAIAEIAHRQRRLPLGSAITGRFGPPRDICPFTVMGMFNRSLADDNRTAIATALAQILDMREQVPNLSEYDDGIPLLDNRRGSFFPWDSPQEGDHIDPLWQVFADAIVLANGGDPYEFVQSYDIAQSHRFVSYNLTMGLYWARPRQYPPLDSKCRGYITDHLQIPLPRRVPSGIEYLELRERLEACFRHDECPVHSFPQMSWAAYHPAQISPPITQTYHIPDLPREQPATPPTYTTYGILADGCFLPQPTLESMLQRLQTKQNLILQGPPGTGKTWLAKKLAYALIGRKDDRNVRPMQFHPNLSYEDFVRGWRPQGDGALALVNGPFLQLVEEAKNNPDDDHVMVIEEINRGNPASIFGEMLTLLEADKRTPDEALALAYPSENGERVYIPPNVYVIGTMNTADRSIAMVDLALRRRFAFFDLEPMLNETWRDWVQEQYDIDGAFLDNIAQRINSLNEDIAADRNLGRQFRIGHSFVTPAPGTSIEDHDEWFEQVVETEIVPLLHEYWFDNPDRVAEARSKLLGTA